MESYIGGTLGGGQNSTEHITDRKVGDKLLDRYEIFDIKHGGLGVVFFVSGSRVGVALFAIKIADYSDSHLASSRGEVSRGMENETERKRTTNVPE